MICRFNCFHSRAIRARRGDRRDARARLSRFRAHRARGNGVPEVKTRPDYVTAFVIDTLRLCIRAGAGELLAPARLSLSPHICFAACVARARGDCD